ncbi:MAG: P1 family peptidase [Spirochaetes bacterium]|nr:P1 family peptidase [Spirochaetota bacterium]
MKNAITDVPGTEAGHAADETGGTGCTVVLFRGGATGGADVRGGAPGTREIPLLRPENLIRNVHAFYIGGGSAYGLDGAGGVMKYLEEQHIGFNAGAGIVPIVPGAVLFDLPVGKAGARPDKEMGYRACTAAGAGNTERGNVGAGTGASVGKLLGMDFAMKGGLGTSSITIGSLVIGAIAAVNCLGDIIDSEGRIIAGLLNRQKTGFASTADIIKQSYGDKKNLFSGSTAGNTTIGVIATNARLDKAGANKIASMAHDGFARAISPVHTMFDGDTIFCGATGMVDADITTVGTAAAEVMAEAVRDAVKSAESAYGLPCFREIKNSIK